MAAFERDPDLDEIDEDEDVEEETVEETSFGVASAAAGAGHAAQGTEDEDQLDTDLTAAEMMRQSIPNDMKGLRSCIPCLMVKTYTQFYEDGCENCPFLQLQEDKDRCNSCTTPHFEGLVSMMQPSKSWVARWQRVAKMRPGCYAIKVQGALPQDVEIELDEANIPNLGKLSQEDES